MRGELKIEIARPIIFFALFWILFVMITNQMGIWQRFFEGSIEVPAIGVPMVRTESARVATEEFMKIAGYSVDKDLVSFYVWAATLEDNVDISVKVDGIEIQRFGLPKGYEYIQPVTMRLPAGSHQIGVYKVKDANILDRIEWTVVVE